MPVMDGYEATKRIRQIEEDSLQIGQQKAIIVGLTAYSVDSILEKGADAGMDMFSKFYNKWT